jgi:hypothetical protein
MNNYYNLHKGETCLIVGVGPNLNLTPPEWFDYPSFGVNTIYKYQGWNPTYYVGVDERLRLEDGAAILERYPDVPKFFPTPEWDALQGENIFRFKHNEGGGLVVAGHLANQPDALTKHGILYYRIMDAVFQIAWHMGFTTMLMIGVQHKPYDKNDSDRQHFWGLDVKAYANQPFDFWFEGYRHFVRTMKDVKILNISADTYVPEDVLPRGDWREWVNVKEFA